MRAVIWALDIHCTYNDSMEPLSYPRIKWWDKQDKHGDCKKMPCINETLILESRIKIYEKVWCTYFQDIIEKNSCTLIHQCVE